MQRYDAIIIGTGQAGPALAHRLAGTGKTVAVVERKYFGGTCVNTGCIRPKTLWRAPMPRTWRVGPPTSA